MKHFFGLVYIFLLILLPVSASGADAITGGAGGETGIGPAATDESATGHADQSADEEFEEEKTIPDPLEKWNRIMFTVNDRLYFWVLKPAAQGYNKVVPEWGRVRVRNIFKNAAMPIRFVNCVLQLKFHSAAKEIGRFLVNSTGGIGGMFDVLADNPNAQMSDRDLGQTLGKYGIGDGFYLVWPFFGPSSMRDTAGLAGDSFLDPINYLPHWETSAAVNAYKQLNATSLRLGQYEDFKESALDPYTALKNAYFQNRQSKLEE